ncbi:hypothetical protein TRICI_006274 [Trichomonascus ciferrii]|uniref:Arrestin C-terminal-like domain-containing protein n=1 Tax=Trichomonascus ciferrii TaxID=44093 RepID=A0A642UIU0_9ASCO|nr:hypothetical protein TRICI_006274 [Trichomonascus ciferrii]
MECQPPKYKAEDEEEALPEYSLECTVEESFHRDSRKAQTLSLEFKENIVDLAFGLGDIVRGKLCVCPLDEDIVSQGIGIEVILYECYKGKLVHQTTVCNYVIPLEAYPENLRFCYGYTYRFPFSMLIPIHLSDGSLLPPSFNESNLYYVRARLVKDNNRIIEAYEDIVVIPAYGGEELGVGNEKEIFRTCKQLECSAGLFKKAKYGLLALEIPGPLVFIVSSWNASLVPVRVHFDPVEKRHQHLPPEIHTISYKLRSHTTVSGNQVKTILQQQQIDFEKLQWNIPKPDGYFEALAQLPITLPFGDLSYIPTFYSKLTSRTYSIEVTVTTKNHGDITLAAPVVILYDPLRVHEFPRTKRDDSKIPKAIRLPHAPNPTSIDSMVMSSVLRS